MKQKVFSITVAAFAFALMSAGVAKNAIKYSKGTAIVNTSSIVKARGFQGKTPLKIYVSGATYSSKALIENVKGGLKYYKENK